MAFWWTEDALVSFSSALSNFVCPSLEVFMVTISTSIHKQSYFWRIIFMWWFHCYFHQGGYVFTPVCFVCLLVGSLVCLFVGRITQHLLAWFSQNLVEMYSMGQGREAVTFMEWIRLTGICTSLVFIFANVVWYAISFLLLLRLQDTALKGHWWASAEGGALPRVILLFRSNTVSGGHSPFDQLLVQ